MLVVVVAPIARRAANRANVGPVALVNIIIVKVADCESLYAETPSTKSTFTTFDDSRFIITPIAIHRRGIAPKQNEGIFSDSPPVEFPRITARVDAYTRVKHRLFSNASLTVVGTAFESQPLIHRNSRRAIGYLCV